MRKAVDDGEAVRLISLTDNKVYLPDQESSFVVPVGLYSVQVLTLQGTPDYQETEFIDSQTDRSRLIGPMQPGITIGSSAEKTTFENNSCAALLKATELALATVGLSYAQIKERLERANVDARSQACDGERASDLAAVLSGSYGKTSGGLASVSFRSTVLHRDEVANQAVLLSD